MMAEKKGRNDAVLLTSKLKNIYGAESTEKGDLLLNSIDQSAPNKSTFIDYESKVRGNKNGEHTNEKFSKVGKDNKPEEYYRKQHHNVLKEEDDQFLVYVEFDFFIKKCWTDEILLAIKDIECAAPGLIFKIIEGSGVKDLSKRPLIRICSGITEDVKYDCTTYGNIKTCKEHPHHPDIVYIIIGEYCKQEKKRTSRHELLHALGFEHEHQRFDAKAFMNHPKTEIVDDKEDCTEKSTVKNAEQKAKENYKLHYNPIDSFYGITPFDIFSVMLYEEDESIGYCRKTSNNGVWSAKCNDTTPNVELSELDKLALNLVYPPCRTSSYAPEQSENGMYYCGREVMSNHNRPNPSLAKHDKCQKGGPNCPACRTLSKPREIESKWQGWSGFVYCGQPFASEGESKVYTCGIHYGKPCPNCHKIIQGRTT